MTDFLGAVKADLLDRHLLPILALLALALGAALAYAALGRGASTAPAGAPVTSSAPGAAAGIVVRPVEANAGQSVAETTSGASQQRASHLPLRDPFTSLPGATSSTPPASTAASSPTAASGSTKTSTQPGPSSAPQTSPASPPTSAPKSSSPAKPQTVPKPKTVYSVAVLFSGSPPQSAPLALFRNLRRQEVLPSPEQAVVAFRGVTSPGKNAVFTLVGTAILRGPAVCLPSVSQCLAIILKQGQTEELEYPQPSGSAVIYQLQALSISSSKASTATAQRLFDGESKAGAELLRRIGLAALPAGVHYSRSSGVLVSAASAARAARVDAVGPGSPLHKR